MGQALNLLADAVLNSTEPSVQSHLGLAENCATTAAIDDLDLRTRMIYRLEQGKHILTAISLHRGDLSAETMLNIAGLIAARKNMGGF